jgi:excisionase family DNA binding protein
VSDPWLSADDIAAHLDVTKDTVYVWIGEKGMPVHKVGRLWRFQRSEVDEWVRGGTAAESGEDSSSSDGAWVSVARDSISDLPGAEGIDERRADDGA